MNLDHIAINVKIIDKSIDWYTEKFSCEIIYKDDTWGLIKLGNTKLAFVMAEQHKPHIGFTVNCDFIEKSFLKDAEFKFHRDGTSFCYIEDIDNNVIEFIRKD